MYDKNIIKGYLKNTLDLSLLEQRLDILSSGQNEIQFPLLLALRHTLKTSNEQHAKASELGLRIAELYAEKFKQFPINFSLIESSPKERAIQTADKFAEVLGLDRNKQVRIDDRIGALEFRGEFSDLKDKPEQVKLETITNDPNYSRILFESARDLAQYFVWRVNDKGISQLAISHSPKLNLLLAFIYKLRSDYGESEGEKVYRGLVYGSTPTTAEKKLFDSAKIEFPIWHMSDEGKLTKVDKDFHYTSKIIPELNGYGIIEVKNVNSPLIQEPAVAFIDNSGIYLTYQKAFLKIAYMQHLDFIFNFTPRNDNPHRDIK